jgi:hypothetical protein
MAPRLRAKGLNFKEIGEEIDASAWNVVMKAPTRTVKPFSWTPGPGRLTIAEREEISLALRAGDTLTSIANELGRAVSTISREVSANGGREGYRAGGRTTERTSVPAGQRPANSPNRANFSVI